MKIAIVDPFPALRLGLASSLRDGGYDVVASIDDVDELGQHELDVVISEIVTPTRSALEILDHVRAGTPGCKLLFLSGVDDAGVIGSLLAAGASGYALKTQPVTDIVHAVDRVQQGERYLPPDVSAAEVMAAGRARQLERVKRLSKREHEVLELTLRGLSHAEIASALFISRRTAETHRQRIIRKLGGVPLAVAMRLGALCRAL